MCGVGVHRFRVSCIALSESHAKVESDNKSSECALPVLFPSGGRLLGVDRPHLVDGLTNDVHDAAKGLRPDRHGDRRTRVDHPLNRVEMS